MMEKLKNYFNSENRKKTITLLVLFVLIILAGYFLLSNKAIAPENGNKNSDTVNSTSTESILNTVSVNDQNPGLSVKINSANFNKAGWISIYTDNEGKPQSIIGAKYFREGSYKDVDLDVFAPMTAGEKYYAVMHSDDGTVLDLPTEYGSHPFDHTKDLVIKKNDGTWLMSEFKILSLGSRG